MTGKRTMREMRLTAVVVTLGVASLAGACADQTVAPQQEPIVPFVVSDAQRTTLGGLLRFATRDESLSALSDAQARTQVVDAFARLSEHVAQNDRGRARRAIVVAREALRLYRERAASDLGALLELEALALALDHAELLAGDTPAERYGVE